MATTVAIEKLQSRDSLLRFVDGVSDELVSIQSLTAAVAAADAQGFVQAVLELVGGPVRLADTAGDVVAEALCDPSLPHSANDPQRARQALHRELTLRDGPHVVGTLRLPIQATAVYDGLITDCGSVFLRMRREAEVCRDLHHRLALLDCVCPCGELAGIVRSCTGIAGNGRFRPVVIGARQLLDGVHGRRILTRLLDSRGREPALDEVRLVLHDGLVVGVVPDDGCRRPSDLSAAWSRLLRSLLLDTQLTVTIGGVCHVGSALRDQFRIGLRVARLQREQSPYLELPRVVVWEELGPVADVLPDATCGQVAPFVERVLGDLLKDRRFDGQLIETLYVYLRTGGSIREAAALLHLHPSSIKYRVTVLRDMLGAQLEDQGQRFELELAARVYMAARQLASGTGGRVMLESLSQP